MRDVHSDVRFSICLHVDVAGGVVLRRDSLEFAAVSLSASLIFALASVGFLLGQEPTYTSSRYHIGLAF